MNTDNFVIFIADKKTEKKDYTHEIDTIKELLRFSDKVMVKDERGMVAWVDHISNGLAVGKKINYDPVSKTFPELDQGVMIKNPTIVKESEIPKIKKEFAKQLKKDKKSALMAMLKNASELQWGIPLLIGWMASILTFLCSMINFVILFENKQAVIHYEDMTISYAIIMVIFMIKFINWMLFILKRQGF
jgi:hypothetical protein